jgi:MoxR-like ATPase
MRCRRTGFATQHLVLASKARCVLAGRHAVDANDLVSLAKPVLRHRILTNFHAEAQNITPDHLIETILDKS